MSTMTTVDTAAEQSRVLTYRSLAAIVFVVCVIGMLVNLGAELLIDGRSEADQRDTVDQLIGVATFGTIGLLVTVLPAVRLAHDPRRPDRRSRLRRVGRAAALLLLVRCAGHVRCGQCVSRRTDEGPHPYDRAGARRRRHRAGVRTAQSHRRGWPGPDLVDLPPQLIQRGSDLGRRDDTIDAADGDDLRMPRTAGWVPSLRLCSLRPVLLFTLDTNLIDPVQIDQRL